jgi:predicted 3-demethylubiquinone-9 3-methyltransferase (glyoxalase superfamily)
MVLKIKPFLWFDSQAEEAAKLYVSTFRNSKMGSVTRYTKAGFDVHHMPEGMVMSVEFEIEGMRFGALNGGPIFKFNPSISFLVGCTTRGEVDDLWSKLSQGSGPALMELGSYPFSERYGWLQDKYGLSWQIMMVNDKEIKQKIVPTFMFVGDQAGKAETAVNFFKTVFHDSVIDHIMRYGKGEEPDKEGTVRHAGFTLEGQEFAAMDSAREHNFAFNEAISLMIECQTQNQIDYYWEKLTCSGGQEGVCGWLKDKFGISWQVAPTILYEMLRDSDADKAVRVTNAFLKMKKFNIAELKKAYQGTNLMATQEAKV